MLSVVKDTFFVSTEALHRSNHSHISVAFTSDKSDSNAKARLKSPSNLLIGLCSNRIVLDGFIIIFFVSQVTMLYRPVVDTTLDDDVEMVPPMLRVY